MPGRAFCAPGLAERRQRTLPARGAVGQVRIEAREAHVEVPDRTQDGTDARDLPPRDDVTLVVARL